MVTLQYKKKQAYQILKYMYVIEWLYSLDKAHILLNHFLESVFKFVLVANITKQKIRKDSKCYYKKKA